MSRRKSKDHCGRAATQLCQPLRLLHTACLSHERIQILGCHCLQDTKAGLRYALTRSSALLVGRLRHCIELGAILQRSIVRKESVSIAPSRRPYDQMSYKAEMPRCQCIPPASPAKVGLHLANTALSCCLRCDTRVTAFSMPPLPGAPKSAEKALHCKIHASRPQLLAIRSSY